MLIDRENGDLYLKEYITIKRVIDEVKNHQWDDIKNKIKNKTGNNETKNRTNNKKGRNSMSVNNYTSGNQYTEYNGSWKVSGTIVIERKKDECGVEEEVTYIRYAIPVFLTAMLMKDMETVKYMCSVYGYRMFGDMYCRNMEEGHYGEEVTADIKVEISSLASFNKSVRNNIQSDNGDIYLQDINDEEINDDNTMFTSNDLFGTGIQYGGMQDEFRQGAWTTRVLSITRNRLYTHVLWPAEEKETDDKRELMLMISDEYHNLHVRKGGQYDSTYNRQLIRMVEQLPYEEYRSVAVKCMKNYMSEIYENIVRNISGWGYECTYDVIRDCFISGGEM